MNQLDLFLWVVFPYIVATVFVVGHFLRYRYDRFNWGTRSSQSYESRLLRWGGPLFHFGLLFVFAGHVMGMLVPKTWTTTLGISPEFYHAMAVGLGVPAGAATLLGFGILIYRRRTEHRIFLATTRMDKVMYALLGMTMTFGLAATVVYQVIGSGYDYRASVAPWIRSVLGFQPDPALMSGVPILMQLHILAAMLLFMAWPFTRLVHVFSAPLGYLIRRPVVYRSRVVRRPEVLGTSTRQREGREG